MPTSFSAFTFRDGYPRRIPDRGTYWHLDKEVKTMNTGGVPANEHPELYRPKPKPTLSKGDKEVQREVTQIKAKNLDRIRKGSDIGPALGPDGKPSVPLKL
jgi:hypothetical protein